MKTSTDFGSPLHHFICVQNRTDIKLREDVFKQVNGFEYLGGTISSNLSCDKDVVRRVGLMVDVARNLRNCGRPKSSAKCDIYRTLVQSIVTYNAEPETLALKEKHKRKLCVF